MSRLFSLWVCAMLGACGSAEEVGEGHEAHEEQGEHEAHAPAEANVVRIDRGMLRDLRITTQAAASRPAGEAATVLGELRVNEDAYAEIGTSLTARVVRVLAAPGDVVTEGQALVVLESIDVGSARASLTTTRARLDLARQTADRRRDLAADQIIAARELEAAEAELRNAEAEHRAAQDTLRTLGAARGSGGQLTLRSPIAGTVIDRAAHLGQMVDQEAPLFVVGDLSRLWLVVHAFERDALRVRQGSTARVTFPALPGQPMTGPITRVGSRVDPTSRTIDVRVELDNPEGILRPGMSATALLPLGDSNESVVAVPVEAVQRQSDGWCVFLPRSAPGVFDIRIVGRGRDLGAEVEILSGLRAGERVVVDGAFLLRAEAEKARGGGGEHHH